MANGINVKYGLKRVINASGRMSILGVSAPSQEVFKAMEEGGQQYVEMADFVKKSGKHVANLLGSESAIIVNSASSGLALSVAAMVTKGEKRKCVQLHKDYVANNEIILLKGHNVQYGAPIETMIYLGGGKPREVGYANEGRKEHIEEAITNETAAILYVKSHHCVQKNMMTVEEMWEVAQRAKVPLIVDAAAEEDLKKYIHYSDLAIYSGSKAIAGPTSGIVAGKKTYIDWVGLQFQGIGRSMKVGKESIFGLLEALEQYFHKKDSSQDEKQSLQLLLDLNQYKGIDIAIVQDEAGRSIYRARVHIDANELGINAEQVTAYLKAGTIAIYTRDYGVKEGFFDIDPRPLKGDDLEIIRQRIEEIVKGNRI